MNCPLARADFIGTIALLNRRALNQRSDRQCQTVSMVARIAEGLDLDQTYDWTRALRAALAGSGDRERFGTT